MLRLLSIAAFSCLLTRVYCLCRWGAYGPDRSGILSDISIPRTLTDVEVFYYTNCTQVATAQKTVYIQGTSFTANPITFTFANPETPLAITYEFHDVTLTSLTAGEVLTYSESLSGTDIAILGSGVYTVTVPIQLYSRPTIAASISAIATTVTVVSSITVTKSSGVSPGAVGGIAAGIVAGFLVLGAIAAFFIFYGRPRHDDMGYAPNEQTGMAEPKWVNQSNQSLGNTNDYPSGRTNE